MLINLKGDKQKDDYKAHLNKLKSYCEHRLEELKINLQYEEDINKKISTEIINKQNKYDDSNWFVKMFVKQPYDGTWGYVNEITKRQNWSVRNECDNYKNCIESCDNLIHLISYGADQIIIGNTKDERWWIINVIEVEREGFGEWI